MKSKEQEEKISHGADIAFLVRDLNVKTHARTHTNFYQLIQFKGTKVLYGHFSREDTLRWTHSEKVLNSISRQTTVACPLTPTTVAVISQITLRDSHVHVLSPFHTAGGNVTCLSHVGEHPRSSSGGDTKVSTWLSNSNPK